MLVGMVSRVLKVKDDYLVFIMYPNAPSMSIFKTRKYLVPGRLVTVSLIKPINKYSDIVYTISSVTIMITSRGERFFVYGLQPTGTEFIQAEGDEKQHADTIRSLMKSMTGVLMEITGGVTADDQFKVVQENYRFKVGRQVMLNIKYRKERKEEPPSNTSGGDALLASFFTKD